MQRRFALKCFLLKGKSSKTKWDWKSKKKKDVFSYHSRILILFHSFSAQTRVLSHSFKTKNLYNLQE